MGLFSWFTRKRPRELPVRSDSVSLLPTVQRTSLPLIPTTPVTSAELELVEGRLMLSAAAYTLPRDEQEISRLDLKHFIVRNALQSHYRAPIGSPQAILDVGTGTGRWAQEMALAFPTAWVVGCDLVEIETSKDIASQIPSNYQFFTGDVLKGLSFADQSFNFIHQRFLIMGIPTALWPQDIAELVRLTRHGGWIEMVETETQARNPGPTVQKYCDLVATACKKRGIDPASVPTLGTMLQEAGLSHVQTQSVHVPIGTWGGHLGTMMFTNLLIGGQALKPLVVSQGLTTADEYDTLFAIVQRECEEYHSMLSFYVAYGQRP